MPNHNIKDEFNQGDLLEFDSTLALAKEVTLQSVLTAIQAQTGGNGAILDGANSAIKATVFDYTNSNPLAVRLTDTNGDYIAAGAGTQYTEDAAAAADPVGSALNLIRKDTLAAITDTDGDNVAARGTNKGELYVKHADSIAVTGTFWQATQPVSGTFWQATQPVSGPLTDTELRATAVPVSVASLPLPSGAATSAKQDTIITAVTDIPNIIGTDGAAGPSKVLSIGGTQATGEIQEIQVDADGQLQVDVLSSALPSGAATSAKQDTGNTSLATLAGAVAGTEVQVDVLTMPTVTVTATNLDVQSGGADLATSAQGAAIQTAVELVDDTVATLGTTTYTEAATKGLIIGAVRRDADTTLVNTTNEIGPLQMDANGRLKTEVFSGETLPVTAVGTVADDSPTPGVPVMIGGKAVETDGTDPTSVSAEDDVAIFRTDRNRRLLVNTSHPNAWSLYEDHTTAQTNNQLKAAPGANLSLYITDVVVSNGATAGTIKLVEDESGTPVQISQTIYMAVNGGAVIRWKTPKRLTANKTLGFTSTTVTTHSIEVHGYIAP